jgi:glycerol-3-phosphate dehydrogenase
LLLHQITPSQALDESRATLVDSDHLKASLVAAGTSSRSTKLVHGGVRYLEKAVKNADPSQLKLVYEALKERAIILQNAPHLTAPLPTMMPCYSWWEIPYYYAGMKLYDLIAWSRVLHLSRFHSASESREMFPTLAASSPDGRSLKGTVVYFDGQMNDARLNVALACTAALAGAAVLNHAEVVALNRDEVTGKVTGARVRDVIANETYDVHAKVVVNATGPFCDSIRKMSDAEARQMVVTSSGVHVVLPDYFSPDSTGLIVPKTKDGRVVFMLPWLGKTIAGTTDAEADVSYRPEPTENEINFILDAINGYLSVPVRAAALIRKEGDAVPSDSQILWIIRF